MSTTVGRPASSEGREVGDILSHDRASLCCRDCQEVLVARSAASIVTASGHNIKTGFGQL